jgi:hypothetical protein
MEWALMFGMIAVITALLVGSGIVLGRREDREQRSIPQKLRNRVTREQLDPDAHLGHCGTE